MKKAIVESNKKIMNKFNWEYFKPQINLQFSELETKKSTIKKLMQSQFCIHKGYFGLNSNVISGVTQN